MGWSEDEVEPAEEELLSLKVVSTEAERSPPRLVSVSSFCDSALTKEQQQKTVHTPSIDLEK